MSQNYNPFKEKYVPIFLIITFITLAVISVIFFTRASYTSWNFSSTGQIGDTIGGLTAPIIGILNAMLLWWTLRLQNQQILDQKIDSNIDRNIDIIREEIRSISIKVSRSEIGTPLTNNSDFDLQGKHKGINALTRVRSMFANGTNRWRLYKVEEHDWLTFSNSVGFIIMLAQDTFVQNQKSNQPIIVKSAKYRLLYILVQPVFYVYVNIQNSVINDSDNQIHEQFDLSFYRIEGINFSTLDSYNPED